MNTQEIFDIASRVINRSIEVETSKDNTIIIFKDSVYGNELQKLQREFGTDVWFSRAFEGLCIDGE